MPLRPIDKSADEHGGPQRSREGSTADPGSGGIGSLAGVPARNTPVAGPTAELPARMFAATALSQTPETTAADANAVALAHLGTRDDNALARLRAGEATSLVLLTATALGLASRPITEPLEIPETRKAVRAAIFFELNEFPRCCCASDGPR